MNDRIKEIRKRQNLTQNDFGARLGISQNFVWMLESGQRDPGDRTIRDICREFGVSEVWLRTGAGSMYEERTREEEMTELVARLMANSPQSFQAALVATLLRFDPAGPEMDALEKICKSIAEETEKA